MSLTSELRDRTSPASRFIRAWFPNHQQVQLRYRAELAGRAVIPAGASVAKGTMGTAFDWHVRFLLKPAPALRLAVFGAALLRRQPAHAAAHHLITTLTTAGRDGRLPPSCDQPDGDRWLARICYALALLTEVFRADLAPGSRLRRLRADSSLGDLLDLYELAVEAPAGRRVAVAFGESAAAI